MTPPGRKPPAEGPRKAGPSVFLRLLPSELAVINAAREPGEPLAVACRRLALAGAADIATRRLLGERLGVGGDEPATTKEST